MDNKPKPIADLTIPAIALNTRGAAQALGLTTRVVMELAQLGELPHYRVGRRRIFDVRALRAWSAKMSERGGKINLPSTARLKHKEP